MATSQKFFFELLQVALGNLESLSAVPSPEEWEEIYEIAKKQTLVGIAFMGVEKLFDAQFPPRTLIRKWFVKADKIRKRNESMNLACARTCFILSKYGFHSCIIKGQANLKNYNAHEFPKSSLQWDLGTSLGLYRTPGDIDVWAWSDSGKVSDVINCFKKKK